MAMSIVPTKDDFHPSTHVLLHPQKWVNAKYGMLTVFTSPGCMYCIETLPHFQNISKIVGGNLPCYNFSRDQASDICDLFQISGFPTFIYFNQEGKPGMLNPGARNEVQIFRLIEQEMSKTGTRTDEFFAIPSVHQALLAYKK